MELSRRSTFHFWVQVLPQRPLEARVGVLVGWEIGGGWIAVHVLSMWMWASHLLVFLRRTRLALEESGIETVGAAKAVTASMLEIMTFLKTTIVIVFVVDDW